MPRSGQEARRRLELAALELYREQGFDRTTSAQIAKRAGVTERTFFHHFGDKREVLFGGEERLRALLLAAVRAAPTDSGPLEVLLGAFSSLDEVMQEERAYSLPRHRLIAATPALRERETAKLASLADTLAGALCERGIAPQRAVLAAHAATTAFNVAAIAWYDDPTREYHLWVADAFDDLRAVCAS